MVRPLLPAKALESADRTLASVATTELKKRRRAHKNISVACEKCRKYKTKCDGKRPVCAACYKRSGEGTTCVYDAGNSRSALRQRNDELQKLLAEKGQGKQSSAEQSQSPEPSSSASSTSFDFDSIESDLNTPKTVVTGGSDATPRGNSGHDSQSSGSTVDAVQQSENVTSFLDALASNTTDAPMRDQIRDYLQRMNQTAQTNPVPPPNFGYIVPTPASGSQYEGSALLGFMHNEIPSSVAAYSQNLLSPGILSSSSPSFTVNPIDICAVDDSASTALLPNMYPTDYGNYQVNPSSMSAYTNAVTESSPDQDSLPAELRQPSLSSQLSGETMGNPMEGFMPLLSSLRANHYPLSIQDMQFVNMQVPPYAIEPMWQNPDSIESAPARWTSDTFVQIRKRVRWMIQNGTSLDAVIGPTSLEALYDNNPRDPNREMNVSDWAQSFVSNFTHLRFSDKVACWAILYRVLRWQCNPCPSTYAAIPHWCRPCPAETYVPHMPIAVALVWPELRRYFVECEHGTDWVAAVTGSISVQWPHAENMAVTRNEQTGLLEMSAAFEDWVDNLQNWSLSRDAIRVLPSIEGKVLLRDGP